MRSRVAQVLTAVFVAGIGYFFWSGYEIWSFGTHDAAERSDCAIVLGAAAYGAKPSPVFEQRLRHAIELHRRGLVRKIIFTGGYGDGAAHAESEVAADYAIQRGVPKEDVLIETRSRTTRENLVQARALMNTHALETAVIVSDPLHLKRATTMAGDLGISAVASPTLTSRYRSLRTRLGFLIREVYFLHHYLLTGH